MGSGGAVLQYRVGLRDAPHDDVGVDTASSQAAAVGRPGQGCDFGGVVLPIFLADLQEP